MKQLVFLMAFLCLGSLAASAQEPESTPPKKEKKVIVVNRSTEDGKTIVEEIILENGEVKTNEGQGLHWKDEQGEVEIIIGDDHQIMFLKEEGEDIELEQEVEVRVFKQEGGETYLRVERSENGEPGETIELEWEGELDEETKKMLEEQGIELKELGKGSHFLFLNEEGEEPGREKIIIRQFEEDVEWVEDTEAEEIPFGTEINTLELKNLKVFPNPTDRLVQIQFEGPAEPTEIRLVDQQGTLMLKEVLKNFDGQYSREWNLKDIEAGSLFLVIRQGANVKTQTIVLEK